MKKFLCAILALVMVVAACVTMVACNLTDKPIEKDEPLAMVTDGEGNDISETVTAMPARMVFAYSAPIANEASEPMLAAGNVLTSTTLTASISPSNASNQKVDWSVEFVNPNSTWAKGKNVTAYLDAVPTEANGLSAKIECYQAFGEQIKITVTSQDNPSAKASCVVDFVKRLNSITCNVADNTKIAFNSNVALTYTLNYTDGTITGTLTPKGIYLKMADTLFNTCKNAVTSGNWAFNQQSSTNASISQSSLSTTMAVGSTTRWMSTTGGNPGNGYAQWQTALYNYVSANPNATHAYITMTADYTYQGRAATTKTVNIPVSFTLASCTINVTGLSLTDAVIL